MAQGGRVCGYARERQMKPEIAAKYDGMKDQLKQGIGELIEARSRPNVPADYGKQNAFFAKVEGQIQSCEQYDDELTKAIALSVIPENIVAMSNQVDQLKALLAWYK